MQRYHPLLLLLVLGCSKQVGDASTPKAELSQHEIRARPSEPLRSETHIGPTIRNVRAAFAFHGGDGDGSVAVWWVEVSVILVNHTDKPIQVESLSWVLDEVQLRKDGPLSLHIAPMASIEISSDRYLTLGELRVLRAWSKAGNTEVATVVGVGLRTADGLTVTRSESRVSFQVW